MDKGGGGGVQPHAADGAVLHRAAGHEHVALLLQVEAVFTAVRQAVIQRVALSRRHEIALARAGDGAAGHGAVLHQGKEQALVAVLGGAFL